MPPKSKGITAHFPLKMRPEERALVEETRRVYGVLGVEMSLNDTIRHLVRRAGIVLASTPGESWAQICEHAKECSDCDMETKKFGCPEGVYLHRSWLRVLRAHSGAQPSNAL